MRVVLGSETIRAYRRLSYKAWYALAEFVDNSTQSYFDYTDELNAVFRKEDRKLEVYITYDSRAKTLKIVDNAMGMSEEDLTRALHIGMPPANTKGRSEYGMGMKTAACWFGDRWTVTTKRLGVDVEYSVVIDVEAVASGQTELQVGKVDKPTEQHYTILEIENLHRSFNGWSIKNTREFLASMFRDDLRKGILDLRFDGTILESPFSPNEDSFLVRPDGSTCKTEVSVDLDGRRVHGYVGVMRPGVASRRLAGFSIVRRGRCVQGWLDSWRPDPIFGSGGGRNDLINQRLTGELHVDDLEVSHTKDAVLWVGDEEERLIKYLQDVLNENELLYIARSHRGEDSKTYAPADRERAIETLRETLSDPEMVDAISIGEVPPPEVGDARSEPLTESAADAVPNIVIPLDSDTKIEIFFLQGHPNDPYYVYSKSGNSLRVSINEAHPGYEGLENAEAVVAYSKHCAFDAIAEWKCRLKQGVVRPESARQIKDELFRISAAVQERLE